MKNRLTILSSCKLKLLIISFLLCSTVLFAQNRVDTPEGVIEKIIDIASKENRTMNHLDVLVNRIGGRLVGQHLSLKNGALKFKLLRWGRFLLVLTEVLGLEGCLVKMVWPCILQLPHIHRVLKVCNEGM